MVFVLKKVNLLMFVFFVTFNCMAQFSSTGGTGNTTIMVTGSLEPISSQVEPTLNEINYTGSPFLSEDYEECEVFNLDNRIGKMYYRYNAYNEEIQVKKSLYTNDFFALIRDQNVSIVTNGAELVFSEFLNQKNQKWKGYLFRLVKGKYALYKRENVKYTDKIKAVTSMEKDVPAKFTKFKVYYIQEKSGEIKRLKLKKKSFLKSLSPEDSKFLKDWSDFGDKKLKNEADLVEIFSYLNKN